MYRVVIMFLDMRIKREISNLLNIIQSGNFLGKELLVKEHKKILDLLKLTASSDACINSIKAIKANLIYKMFKLAEDPNLIKLITSKIVEYKDLEKILNASDIVYSEKEKIGLNNRLNVLELAYRVEMDLNKAVETAKEEGHEKPSFFSDHFEELASLKETLSSDAICPDDVEYFFNTRLFDLIAAEPYNFSVKLTDIYKVMIHNIKLVPTKKFDEQRKILLDKKTKEGQVFDYEAFRSILYDAKNKLKLNLKRHLEQPGSHTFHKVRKISVNKLPKLALKNNLDLYSSLRLNH
jgi:hypothetical protein